ncbi:unnamed protein product [Timema podura]|uniref:Uncharacterized protein n=1 Tax=Timema podura TaxID=61482 RepID=A0ABN7P6R1_TIMPD|nr:unnamed protein product [Timema podura]
MNNGDHANNDYYVPNLDDSLGTLWERVHESAGILAETSGSGHGGRIGELESVSSTDGEILVARQQLKRNLISRIKRAPFKPFRRYLSDVLACEDARETDRISRQVIRIARDYPRNLCLISTHDDHVHVVHDCLYSDGSCRCKIFKEEAIKVKRRRAIRKVKRSAQSSRITGMTSSSISFPTGDGFSSLKWEGPWSEYWMDIKLQERGYQTSDIRQVLETCTIQGSGELLVRIIH